MNLQQVAARVDKVAAAKQKIAKLEDSIAGDIELLKRNRGGESELWRAEIVRMPKRTMTVKAHDQLRLFVK